MKLFIWAVQYINAREHLAFSLWLTIALLYSLSSSVYLEKTYPLDDRSTYHNNGVRLKQLVAEQPSLAIDWFTNTRQFIEQDALLSRNGADPFRSVGTYAIITLAAITSVSDNYVVHLLVWTVVVASTVWFLLTGLLSPAALLCIFSLPTVGFFSWGISKESITIVALALLLKSLSAQAWSWFGILVSLGMVFLIKPEFGVLLLLALGVYAVFIKYQLRDALITASSAILLLMALDLVGVVPLLAYVNTYAVQLFNLESGSQVWKAFDPPFTYREVLLGVPTNLAFAVVPTAFVSAWSAFKGLSLVVLVLNLALGVFVASRDQVWSDVSKFMFVIGLVYLVLLGTVVPNAGAMIRYQAIPLVLVAFGIALNYSSLTHAIPKSDSELLP